MTNEELYLLRKHINGGTISHKSPFSEIMVPCIEDDDMDFYEQWVVPFYRARFSHGMNEQFITRFKSTYPNFTKDVAIRLLSDSNWRAKICGALYAGVFNLIELEDDIGKLLLRSDACFAGRQYCVALASFNSDKSIEYLKLYLDYYLTRKDLWFDQSDAIGAIALLDKKNGTHYCDLYIEKFESYISDKPNLSMQSATEKFKKEYSVLELLR